IRVTLIDAAFGIDRGRIALRHHFDSKKEAVRVAFLVWLVRTDDHNVRFRIVVRRDRGKIQPGARIRREGCPVRFKGVIEQILEIRRKALMQPCRRRHHGRHARDKLPMLFVRARLQPRPKLRDGHWFDDRARHGSRPFAIGPYHAGTAGSARPQNGISSSRSPRLPPPPPAIAGWRGAGRLAPKSLLSSPKPLPPPPPPARSSMVSAELKPCSTTSVEYFSTPC